MALTSVFISHSSADADADAAGRIRDLLQQAGVQSLFLDFDPVAGIPAGRRWENEIYSRVRRSDALVALISEASMGSPWCFAEVCLARSLRRPVLPLALGPGLRHPLLADTQHRELASVDAPAVGRWLRQNDLEPAESVAEDVGRPPYPGLRPFAPEDAAYFFGRSAEVEKLMSLLNPEGGRFAGRFVALVGPSGSGKSSLLHAGLRPRLARSPQPWVVLPPFAPGPEPTRRLAYRLGRALADRGSTTGPQEAARAIGERGAPALVDLARQLVDLQNDDARVLILIDQAEELLTLTGEVEQKAFLSVLTGALSISSPVWVVATLRSEYLAPAPGRAGLAKTVDDVVAVEPLGGSRLYDVILRPARRADLEFESGLVERMVADAAGGDALPLLAYTLWELQRLLPRGEDGAWPEITSEVYDKIGGVHGALENHANRLVEELRRRGCGDAVIPALLHLVTVDRDQEPSRRRAWRRDFDDSERVVVDAFVDASLLVTDHDSTERAETTVEVAHEALLRHWPLLRGAIEAGRDRLSLRTEFERLVDDWVRSGHDDSYLLRGTRLTRFVRWSEENRDDLRDAGRMFLHEGRALDAAELARARRSVRRLRWLSAGLAAVLVALVAVSLLARSAQLTAENAQRSAILRNLSVASDLARAQDPRAALRLALAAHAVEPSPSTEASILETLTATPYRATLAHHDAAVTAVAFASKGTVLASVGEDGHLVLWSLANPDRVEPFEPAAPVRQGPIRAVAFSPAEPLVATAGADHSVVLWDYADSDDVHPVGPPLVGHRGEVLSVAFSPDGSVLATGSDDSTVILWDVSDPANAHPIGEPLAAHLASVFALAFSPDGKTLATGSLDSTVLLWDVTAPGRPAVYGTPVIRHDRPVYAVAFSPDGRTLATGGLDMTALLWDVGDPRSPRRVGPPLAAHTDYVKSVAFSPDGRFLATAGDDRRTLVWDVADPRRPVVARTVTGHSGGVTAVRFSMDGETMATASRDRTVVLWDTAGTDQPRLLGDPAGGGDLVWAMAVTPDGRSVITGSGRDAVIWDITDPARPVPQARLVGHTANIHGMGLSRDGRTLATASADWSIRLWDVSDRSDPLPIGRPLMGHDNWVNAVAFLPDGRTLVSGGADSRVRLWDVSDPLRAAPIGDPLTAHTDTVQSLAVSRDGRLLATAGWDKRVLLWDVSDPRAVHLAGPPAGTHVEAIYSLSFDGDSRVLASASRDKTVAIWDVADPRVPRTAAAPGGGADRPLNVVALSPDGRMLVTGDAEGAIRIYDITDRGLPRPLGAPLVRHHGEVRALAVTPDGRTLVSGGTDGQVLRWDLGALVDLRRDAVAQACLRAGGPLDRESWQVQTVGYPYLDPCPS